MDATALRTFTSEFLQRNPCIRHCYRTYRDNLVSAHKRKCQLKFLKNCLNNCVIPKSMLPRNLHFYNNEPFSATAKQILIDTIDRLNEEINGCFKHVRISLNKLESTMLIHNLNHYDAFAKLINHCFNVNRDVIRRTEIELNQKFDVIFRNSPWVKYSNSNNVVNMSSVPLT